METPRLIHDYLPKLHAFGIVHVMNISVLSSETLITPFCTCAGFVGMALSYGLSLNNSFVFSIQNQCQLSNQIISVEKVDHGIGHSRQYKFVAFMVIVSDFGIQRDVWDGSMLVLSRKLKIQLMVISEAIMLFH